MVSTPLILNILQPTKVVDAKRLCKKEDDGLDEEEEVGVTHKAFLLPQSLRFRQEHRL